MHCNIGIKAISSYIPKNRISNLDLLELFGITEDFIANKVGVVSRAVKEDDEDTADLCFKAYHALCEKVAITPEDIQCVIVCTQNPEADGLPHTSAMLCDQIGCKKETASFDISLGCSGYVYSLSIASSFMAFNGLDNALLFTADPYSKIVDPLDKNTSLLFGDASSATLLSVNSIFTIEKMIFGTNGAENRAIYCKDGKLRMNGRAIYNFAMTEVPKQINKLFELTGYTRDDIDLFLFHQGSKYLLDSMIRRMKLDPMKVPINISHLGNTVSSSIPLLLEDHIDNDTFKRVLICGFGVGLSTASAVLKRT